VPFAKYDFFSKPGWITEIAAWGKKILPVTHDKQTRLNYLYRLADLASQRGTDVYYSSTTVIFSGYYDQLRLPVSTMLDDPELQLSSLRESGLSGLQKIMAMDFMSILPDILLVKMDIATMAHSLEGRSPFLSKDMLQFAPGLPDRFKVQGTVTKYLLRKLADKYLPAALVNQPKRGFEVPLKQWVDKELHDIIFDYIGAAGSISSQYVNPEFLRRLLDRKTNLSDEKRAKMLYTLFSLEVWYRKCYLPTAG